MDPLRAGRRVGLGQLCVPDLAVSRAALLADEPHRPHADSDAYGRVPAFHLTFCFSAVFGTASAFAPTFGWLCFALFCLGTGVGGSMPTDGTLCVPSLALSCSTRSSADSLPRRFLENTPKTKHYLLTALSVLCVRSRRCRARGAPR